MTSWSAPATCSYTQVIPGVTDVYGEDKYAVPLTTVFRPPPGCRFPLEALAAPKCWPPSRENVWDAGGFYSPGLCPSEYTVGCTATAGEKLNGMFIRANETAGICVPSDFVCSSYSTSTIDFAIPRTMSGSADGATAYRLPAFQIRWRSSDIPCIETHPLSSSHTPSTTITTTIPSSAASPMPTLADLATFGGGLSPGAVAGVAIAALIAALILALGAVRVIMRKKRRAMTVEQGEGPPPPFEDDTGVKELYGGTAGNYGHGTQEPPGYGVQPHDIELSATPRVEDRGELEAQGTPSTYAQEMPGTGSFIQHQSELSVGSSGLDQGGVSAAELSGRPTVKRKSLPVSSPLLQMGEGSSPGRAE